MRQPAQILGPTRGARLSAWVFALLFALGALIPAPVARASAPADVEFHHHDAFGNLIAITDAQGQRIWRGTPEPYGAGAARFQGRPRESSDVFLLGARAYDPLAGKFLSPDPQSLTQVDLTRPEQFNRYAYALNNPYRYQDPNGEVPVETLLDIADVASSAYDLYNEPSWMNAGFLAWSVASVALPYVPGAWAAKGLKKGGKVLDAFDGAKDASHAVEAGSDAAATCARGGCTSHGLCFAAGTLVGGLPGRTGRDPNGGSNGRLCPQPDAGALMKYFELFDDITIPRRWHLGEVTLADGTEPRLRAGLKFMHAGALTAPVTRPGRVLEFSLTSFAVPVATNRIAQAVSRVARADVQCLPVDIPGHPGMMVLNALRVIPCLDETRSEFIKWTKQDHRADLAGKYRQVTNLVLAPEAVPADAHFFRVEGWLVALIVSEAVKQVMESVGCLGAKFIELRT